MPTLSLESRVIKTESIAWRSFKYIQQDDFKNWDDQAKNRLRNSILSNQFAQPFYVWHDQVDDVIYCLDGRHRTLMLEILSKEGVLIPELLPSTFINCGDLQEAARLVLIYSSIYARVTNQGLFDFLQMYDLEYEAIKKEMDIPELSLDRFEQKFDMFKITEEEEPDEPELVNTPIQEGDVFEINGHRLACGSFKDSALLQVLMGGEKARILNCDPPYNIPMSTITSQDVEDFAEGVGEMSDDEFVLFLAEIMKNRTGALCPWCYSFYFYGLASRVAYDRSRAPDLRVLHNPNKCVFGIRTTWVMVLSTVPSMNCASYLLTNLPKPYGIGTY